MLYLKSVEKALKKLDKNKGAGPDELPAIFIKNCAATLAYPLYLIFNRSLATGIFPDKWKFANVVPIPKSGQADDILNYRPISLLSHVSKVFESLICPYLSFQLQSILIAQQHGFRNKMSTVSNLTEYTTQIIDNIDKGYQVDAIYMDVSKAFDRVDHMILISKLYDAGIQGTLLSWLSSYLSCRQQKVVVCGYESDPFRVPSGVPQGSHLGPMLFLVYINDVCDNIKSSNFTLFADDLKIFKAIKTPLDSDSLQNDLNSISDWSAKNKLPLNIKKCLLSVHQKKLVVCKVGLLTIVERDNVVRKY
ncbi:jg3180 [Pararge aegeria aegeria]|uniref:Jg3180 protein n=2 Tax=Pararge aegeria TaxID=116150 RepID=A0A8S4QQK2_9NEOP|nr:jg3180 [Pararge aegeria aegeria]